MAALPDLLGRSDLTRDDVRQMEETGVLTGRYELLEGRLVNTMSQNPPHAWSLRRVFRWLNRVFGEERLTNQAPVEVALNDQRRNEPQPDIAVLLEDKPEYATRHPRGDELVLAVEVADSSSRFDLTVKARLYARAGVPQYWVLDLPRRKLVVFRGLVDGAYTQRTELGEDDWVSVGDSRIRVGDLLPAA